MTNVAYDPLIIVVLVDNDALFNLYFAFEFNLKRLNSLNNYTIGPTRTSQGREVL